MTPSCGHASSPAAVVSAALTPAIGMLRADADVTVLEQTTTLREVGAG